MKSCAYCGHEEPDETVHCTGCGTEFGEPVDSQKQTEKDLGWVRTVVLYGSVCFFGVVLYLLSLGPVLRYCGKIALTPPVATGGATFTAMRTIQSPNWVYVIYYPAFQLLSISSVAEAYQGYLEWWQR